MKVPFLHSVTIPEQAIAADGIYTYDLGVNPLSCLYLALRPLNETSTLSNFASYLNICKAVNSIAVTINGLAIVRMRGEDLAALNYFRHGFVPFQGQHDDTDNERRCVLLPLLFGRRPWDRKSCLPAVNRGELQLELDLDVADTGYDGLRISAESLEFPDAKPTEFERKVSINQTLAATGDQDIDLPIGGTLRGALLWGTTGFAGASPAPSFGRLKVLVDNLEAGYAASDFEVMQQLCTLMGGQPPRYDAHDHNQAANTDTVTNGVAVRVGEEWENWGFLDYDPTGDDEFALDLSKARNAILRPNAETADAVRVVPIERVPASYFARG